MKLIETIIQGSFLKNLFSSDKDAIMGAALTGTPIINHDTNTKDIFGDYIHTYYYNESISDGYTLRLLREKINSNFKRPDAGCNERFVYKSKVYSY